MHLNPRDPAEARLAVALAKPPCKEDLDSALKSITEAKRLASIASGRVSGRMKPEGLTWEESAKLATATKDLAYHAGWMLAILRRAHVEEVAPDA
jgi:hypothetical protein